MSNLYFNKKAKLFKNSSTRKLTISFSFLSFYKKLSGVNRKVGDKYKIMTIVDLSK